MGQVITEAEMVAYMSELSELEKAGERAPANIGPYTAIVMIGALQLAMRHPEMSPVQLRALGELIDQFRPWFAGTLGETLIDMGNDPALDR